MNKSLGGTNACVHEAHAHILCVRRILCDFRNDRVHMVVLRLKMYYDVNELINDVKNHLNDKRLIHANAHNRFQSLSFCLTNTSERSAALTDTFKVTSIRHERNLHGEKSIVVGLSSWRGIPCFSTNRFRCVLHVTWWYGPLCAIHAMQTGADKSVWHEQKLYVYATCTDATTIKCIFFGFFVP